MQYLHQDYSNFNNRYNMLIPYYILLYIIPTGKTTEYMFLIFKYNFKSDIALLLNSAHKCLFT